MIGKEAFCLETSTLTTRWRFNKSQAVLFDLRPTELRTPNGGHSSLPLSGYQHMTRLHHDPSTVLVDLKNSSEIPQTTGKISKITALPWLIESSKSFWAATTSCSPDFTSVMPPNHEGILHTSPRWSMKRSNFQTYGKMLSVSNKKCPKVASHTHNT